MGPFDRASPVTKPGQNGFDKIASLPQQSGQNGIILPWMYFHLKNMRIIFIIITKVREVNKATTVEINSTYFAPFPLFFLVNFIPVDRAEISHINRQQNSSW